MMKPLEKQPTFATCLGCVMTVVAFLIFACLFLALFGPAIGQWLHLQHISGEAVG